MIQVYLTLERAIVGRSTDNILNNTFFKQTISYNAGLFTARISVNPAF